MAAGAQVLGTAVVQLQADTAQFRAQTAQASANLRQVDAQARAASTGMSTFAKAALAAGAGMAVFAGVRGLQAGIRGLIEFDSAMQQSLSIMGDVSSVMRGRMTEAAREVGESMNFAAREGAEAFFFLASAGLDAEQSLAALPAVAEFARAGMFDFATATDLATDAQSALGLTVQDAQQNLKNMTRVTDTLVKANTLANATVQQFSSALTSEAGAAIKTFGKDIEEGVAVLAAFADQGIKAEKAGSGLSRIFRLMASAAVNNSDAMDRLGIEFFDAQGNMKNMADVIENLENVLGDMSDQQRTAALEAVGFSARVQGILQPLLGTSAAIREYEAELRAAAGTTKDVADRQMQSLENRLGSLRVAFDNWRTEGLEKIVPAIEFVVDNADTLANVLVTLATVAGGALIVALGRVAKAHVANAVAITRAANAERVRLKATADAAKADLAAAQAASIHGRALQGLAISSEAAAAAQARIANASRVAAGAQVAAVGATSRLGAAFKGLLAFIGGTTGLVIIGLVGLVAILAKVRKGLKETAAEAEALADRLDVAARAIGSFNQDATQATFLQMADALSRARAEAIAAESAFNALAEAQREEGGGLGVAEARALAQARAEMDRTAAEAERLQVLFDAAQKRLIELGRGDLSVLQGEFQRAEEEVGRYSQALLQAEATLKKLQEGGEDVSPGTIQDAREEVEKFERLLVEARRRYEELAARLGEPLTLGVSDEGARQVSELVEALRAQVEEEQTLLDATREGEEALAAANREVERAADLRDALAEAQAGEVGTVTALVNAIHDLRAARAQAAEAAQEQAEAEEAAARARERALEGFGEARSELLLQIRNTHQLARAARDGADALREEEIAQASAAAARSLGAAATAEEREEIEELVEAVMRLRDAFEEEQRERQNAAAEARRFAEPWLQAARNIQDAFSGAFRDLLSGELDSFRDFADRVLDIFIDLAAQIASVMAADALGIPDLLRDLETGGVSAIKGIQKAAAEAVQAAAGPAAGIGVGISTGDPFAGAAAGALTGAAFGGPVGALLGGAGGLLGGFLGDGDDAARERERAERERVAQEAERAADALARMAAQLEEITRWEQLWRDAFAGLDKLVEETLGIDLDLGPWEEEIRALVDAGASDIEILQHIWGDAVRELDPEVFNDLVAGVGSFVEATERAREAFEREQAAIADNLEVRRLSALGLEEEARALQDQIEVQEALADGWTDANIAALEHVQALEEEVLAQEAAARAARQAADFFAQLAAEEAMFRGDDEGAARILGEARVEERLQGFRDLVEDGVISQADFARISRFVWANFETAMEEQAAETARRIAQQVTDFQTLLASESAKLAGDDIEVQRILGEAQIAQTLSSFEDLVEAGELSAEEFRELARVLGDNLTKALEEAERAAREAAEAERFRARVDTDNLRVQLLQLQGMDREALALRQQIELMQALHEERGAAYIAILRQIHAIQAQNLAQEEARKAQEEAAKAAEDTARSMNRVTEALNAPAGLRLSLLQWRAAVVDTPVGPSFEEATGFANTLGGTGGALTPAPQEVVDVTASVDQAPPTVVEVEGLSGFTAATAAFQDAVADFAAVESQAPSVAVEAVTNVTATAGAQAVPSVEMGEAPALTAAAASFLESTEGFAAVATSFQASAANFSAAVTSFRETVDSVPPAGAPEGPSAPVTSVEETAGFAFAAEGRPAPSPSTVQNYYIRNRFGDAVIRVSERDTEEEVLRKWRKALEGTTRRGGVNPATIGPTVV